MVLADFDQLRSSRSIWLNTPGLHAFDGLHKALTSQLTYPVGCTACPSEHFGHLLTTNSGV